MPSFAVVIGEPPTTIYRCSAAGGTAESQPRRADSAGYGKIPVAPWAGMAEWLTQIPSSWETSTGRRSVVYQAGECVASRCKPCVS
ncbi:hypothetical protein VTI74DRAFT_11451 [Chaetomium olivicolor]